MKAGVWNLIVGGAFLVGGLSGKLVLFGTNSPMALAAFGGVMVALGGYQLLRR